MFEQIISLIAPFECLHCGAEGALLCAPCLNNTLNPTKRDASESVLNELSAACLYKGVAKELVASLKFGRAKAACLPMALAMRRLLPTETAMAITHVPTATSRVRMRGYDQAALIAKELARISSTPYIPLLHRQGQQRQVGKHRAQRVRQLTDAYWVRQSAVSPNITYVLVDDVITTGSTFAMAGQALHRAGATKIVGLAFAAA